MHRFDHLKNESSFYCKLRWNDLKTKQTQRTCSIYSLLLTHLKEHTDHPPLAPPNMNVFRTSFWTTSSLNILGKILWKWVYMLLVSVWKSTLCCFHQTLTTALFYRYRSFVLTPALTGQINFNSVAKLRVPHWASSSKSIKRIEFLKYRIGIFQAMMDTILEERWGGGEGVIVIFNL